METGFDTQLEELRKKENSFIKNIDKCCLTGAIVTIVGIVVVIYVHYSFIMKKILVVNFWVPIILFLSIGIFACFGLAMIIEFKARKVRKEQHALLVEHEQRLSEERQQFEKEKHMRIAGIIRKLPQEFQEQLLQELPDVKLYMLLNAQEEQSE